MKSLQKLIGQKRSPKIKDIPFKNDKTKKSKTTNAPSIKFNDTKKSYSNSLLQFYEKDPFKNERHKKIKF